MTVDTTAELMIDGCALYYRLTGHPQGARLVLVHGGGAHSGWWDEIVPLLAPRYQLLIPDLSGHGDSGHRESYSGPQWADEVVTLSRHVGWSSFRLVGHSMGGKVGVVAAALHSDSVDGLVLIDSALRPPAEDGDQPQEGVRRAHRPYATVEEALSRFYLRPGPSAAPPETVRRLGRAGLREVDGGWAWKFDPRSRLRIGDQELHDRLPAVRCPVAVVYGSGSPYVGPDTLAYVEERLGAPVARRRVEAAYHHVPVDQPLGCADAVEAVLETFDTSP
jgi:pimeloyl-ACP methyl ester carboxylesterase